MFSLNISHIVTSLSLSSLLSMGNSVLLVHFVYLYERIYVVKKSIRILGIF